VSLRRRLLLGLITIAAVLVVTNLTLANRYESFLLERVDRQLIDVASRPVFRDEGRGPGRRAPEEQTLSEYFIAVAITRAAPFRQVGSAFADEDQSPPQLDRATVLQRASLRSEPFDAPSIDGDGSWRLVAVDTGRNGVTVVGVSLGEIDATLARMQAVQRVGTLAVLASLGLVFWWVLRLGVHPIEDMAVTADAIAAGDLSRRVTPPSERTEAGRLALAFNAMLERIQQAFKEREASEERVRRFAADASHELRTPLTSIMGYAELYRAGGLRGEDELAGAMGRVEQEGKRMAALVEDLLQLARLDEHRPPERRRLRLDELVAGAVRDARAVEPDRPITDAISPVSVEGDEGQLRQLVGNLLSNARAHTPAGTPVHVAVLLRDGKAVLEVTDEGPGMDPAAAAKVFDRFYRADKSRARAAGGSGLGLAIVDAVAIAHGGRAGVTSSVGDGARFTVELPVSPPPTGPGS
jgi:two-component system OmpR family sensor kinase